MCPNNVDKSAPLKAIASDQNAETATVPDTREENEISSAVGELMDKIWFNRHCNRAHDIENGDILVVPDGTKTKCWNNVIHERIWRGAQKSAQRIVDQYEDTGPWTDFEWGMLNGKLSALRWVLGDEWDMLDI